jgi:hypothetical protein
MLPRATRGRQDPADDGGVPLMHEIAQVGSGFWPMTAAGVPLMREIAQMGSGFCFFGHLGAHSITSSAATSRPGGTVRPSAFAVLRLMTVSYLVGTCTGRSAGFAPRRMRST